MPQLQSESQGFCNVRPRLERKQEVEKAASPSLLFCVFILKPSQHTAGHMHVCSWAEVFRQAVLTDVNSLGLLLQTITASDIHIDLLMFSLTPLWVNLCRECQTQLRWMHEEQQVMTVLIDSLSLQVKALITVAVFDDLMVFPRLTGELCCPVSALGRETGNCGRKSSVCPTGSLAGPRTSAVKAAAAPCAPLCSRRQPTATPAPRTTRPRSWLSRSTSRFKRP